MAILLFFIETKTGRRLAITGAITIGLLIGWLFFKTHYYNQGWTDGIRAVAIQDGKAINERNKALQEANSCRNGGGHWDISNWVCVH